VRAVVGSRLRGDIRIRFAAAVRGFRARARDGERRDDSEVTQVVRRFLGEQTENLDRRGKSIARD
jgi:hypothetical protein